MEDTSTEAAIPQVLPVRAITAAAASKQQPRAPPPPHTSWLGLASSGIEGHFRTWPPVPLVNTAQPEVVQGALAPGSSLTCSSNPMHLRSGLYAPLALFGPGHPGPDPTTPHVHMRWGRGGGCGRSMGTLAMARRRSIYICYYMQVLCMVLHEPCSIANKAPSSGTSFRFTVRNT